MSNNYPEGRQYICDICKNEERGAGRYGELELPKGWEEVSGYDVCYKCCKILRAFADKEV